MPAVKTASQRGKANRDKGAKTERELCTWLRPWWPDVDRAVRTGYRAGNRESRDNGDVIGTPGIVWSVKNAERERISTWWPQLMAMRPIEGEPDGMTVRLLVVKNNGHSCPAEWWCWQPLWQLVTITTGLSLAIPEPGGTDLVRCHLATVVHRLRVFGYGEPLESAA